MDFLLETANLEQIRHCLNYYPISGISCNPSLIAREGIKDFASHFESVRSLLGNKRSLLVQLTSRDAEAMLREATLLQQELGEDVICKVPCHQEGLRAIKFLEKSGIRTAATAIFTCLQAYLAIEAGAEIIVPYFNRMVNLDINATETVAALRRFIDRGEYETTLMVASFKNIAQVNSACMAGADAVNLSPKLYEQALTHNGTEEAIRQFQGDWRELYQERTLAELLDRSDVEDRQSDYSAYYMDAED